MDDLFRLIKTIYKDVGLKKNNIKKFNLKKIKIK